MSDGKLTLQGRGPIRSFTETIPVRGCKLSLEDVKATYRELSEINRKFGEEVIATVERFEGESDEEFKNRKDFLLKDAFCLAVTIRGGHDQEVYDEGESIFSSADLPKPVRSIFFTNLTAWRRHANNSDPRNRVQVLLDFGKPELLDPDALLSAPTPNNSDVVVQAEDVPYFRAVQRVVSTNLQSRRTWYSPIHRSFAYDVGVWLIALPAALIVVTYYMEKWFPIGGELEAYRWAFFAYAMGIALITYRFLTSYLKWAFPVNVLTDNKDAAWRHRIALGAIVTGLAWKVVDVIYTLLPFGA